MHKFQLLLSLPLIALFASLSHAAELVDKTDETALVSIYRERLGHILESARKNPELFPPQRVKKRLLSSEDKNTVLEMWKTALDYVVALEFIAKENKRYRERNAGEIANAFLTLHASALAAYSFALQWVEIIENDPSYDVILNEPMADLGIEKGSYAEFKYEYLNVIKAGEFAALQTIRKSKFKKAAHPGLDQGALQDEEVIWKMARGAGTSQTVKNATRIVMKIGTRSWLPVQTGVANWMGDTRVRRKKTYLIDARQISGLLPRLEPGDIFLERREWYLSNVGLPGFWTHAALYTGTPEERERYFDDPATAAWVKSNGVPSGRLEDLLMKMHPESYETHQTQAATGERRLLEAIGEGVSFTSLEESASADSLAVLRPNLSKRDKAAALLRAWAYAGRPYDYDFDFVSDAALVCSELILKAYQPTRGTAGLNFELTTLLGKPMLPPNRIARQFDEESRAASPQLSLVVFLDGNEWNNHAVEKDPAAFQTTWRRPKWHIFTQKKRQYEKQK